VRRWEPGLLVVAGLACSAKTGAEAPGAGSEAVRSSAPAPTAPAAALALARTFAPDHVGALVPRAPAAGDYAMALTMGFSTFVTTELRIDERRTGAMRLTLAPDGTARACLGSRIHKSTLGQYHYEPPGRRQHHEEDDARLLALAGAWTVRDDVATIRFDRVAWSTCDATKAEAQPTPYVELRCVGFAPTAQVPVAGLACEASAPNTLLGLGMPLGATAPAPSRRQSAPTGRQLLLGAPGLTVEARQDARAGAPTFTFTPGPVTLDETAYRSGD